MNFNHAMLLPLGAASAMRAPIFAPLHAIAGELPDAGWPGCADLNRLAEARAIRNCGGQAIRFVAQSACQSAFEEKYEPRTFLRGEVQTRAENWHDLLNALVWLAFPRAKAALNRRHYAALCAQQAAGALNRGPQQDALTLFDEGGVIVMCADAALSDLLRGHAWKTLFWQRREELAGAMNFFVFGHALYEKALAPFAGVTGRGVIFDCAPDFFRRSQSEQMTEIDARLAAMLDSDERFRQTDELAAVPVLGVPGWCAENASASYYDNAGYFRPLPLRKRRRQP